MLADIEIHEDARMAAEALLQERPRDFSGVVRQQLRLHAMDTGRLLQGFDNVSEQTFFDLVPVGTTGSVANRFADRVADKEVADNALVLFVHKKGVAKDAAPLDGGIAGEDFGIHVPEDHLGRGGIVPRERAPPKGVLLFRRRSRGGGREMSEIKNFHKKKVSGRRFQVSGKTCARNSITSLESGA